MKNLFEIRDEIDRIDKQIVQLYEQRMVLVGEVAEYKITTGKQVLDKTREQEKLAYLTSLATSDFTKMGVHELFEQIIAMSRKKQYQLLREHGKVASTGFEMIEQLDYKHAKIVYQGVEGAYSQLAMKTYFGEEIDGYHVDTWNDAMEAILNGDADFAVLPIENSSAGIVSENFDLLVAYQNYIVGEQTIKISHALLGLPGSGLEDITCVYSHPQALMQCVDFLDEHKHWERVGTQNTAGAAKKILEDGLKHQAAIASRLTAEIYGLELLKENINYSNENSTRFIIVSNKKICRKQARKISICFELPHESGTLYQMLSHFIYNNLNMNKIESRPIKDKSFAYRFFIDFEGNLAESAVQNALQGLKEESLNLKILGNY
ncbi:prephenate dehydratase [Lachnospiraceae bacterium ZAX-1]